MHKLIQLKSWLKEKSLISESAMVSRLHKEAVSKASVDELKSWLSGDYDQLSFNDLFEGKLRISIPLMTKQENVLTEVIAPLRRDGWMPAGSGGTFDIKKVMHKMHRLGGEAYEEEIDVADFKIMKLRTKTIPSGPRAGEVIEDRKIVSLAKAIKAKATGELFRWWQDNQADYSKDFNWKQVEAAFEGRTGIQGSSIIISRDPLDVLRMSDHKNIRSCHSEGASYFECAVAESRGNGLVAYLVDNKDLSNLLGDEELSSFDEKEIFSDRDRDIDGITPKSRVRLRKYVVSGGADYEFAAPENSTYGPHPPGFVGAVRSWAWNSQKELFGGGQPDLSNEDLPRMHSLEMHGGSYRDTNDDVILNRFFSEGGLEGGYVGNAETVSDNEQSTQELWEQEIEQLMERVHAEAEHMSFTAEVYEGDGYNNPHVDVSTSIYGEISYRDVDNSENTLPTGSSYSWEWKERKSIEDFFDHTEHGELGQLDITDDTISWSMDFRCDDCWNPDDAVSQYNFMLKYVDKTYKEYVEKVRRKLVREGYIHGTEFDESEKRVEKFTLNNFSFYESDDEGEFYINLKPESAFIIQSPSILSVEDIPKALDASPHPYTRRKHILGEEYKNAALVILNKIAEESFRQLSFDFGDDMKNPDVEKFSLEQVSDNIVITLSAPHTEEELSSSGFHVGIRIKIDVDNNKDQILLIERFMLNVDKNLDDIKASIRSVIDKNLGVAAEGKRADKESFLRGDLALPVIAELKKSNQPDVIRLALWVEKNWNVFSEGEKDVAYYSFLLPAQRSGDYIHKHESSSPKWWDSIMQRRPDTDISYRWKGISMRDVMPYTDPDSEPGKDVNYGSGGAWVDESGRISPPTVAQLEKLFIK